MQEYELNFARIIVHDEHLAEVIINDGIEMDMDIVEAYHTFLQSHLKAPFSLLINKINSYSYSFEAQQNIVCIPEIDRMAVLVYRKSTLASTESLISMPRKQPWNIKVFANYEEAWSWLNVEKLAAS